MSSDRHRERDSSERVSDGSVDGYRAVVEEYDDRCDQCTIFPRDATGLRRMSTWVSAREGSYVDLTDVR